MLKKNSYVGIDLGHFTIKVSQIDKTPQGWRVTRSGLMYTPENTIRDGVVTDPATLAGALKLLLKQTGIAAKNAVISVQGGSVVVRPVRIPKMAEQLLRKSIKFEASRYIPNSVEESYVEFEIIGAVDDQQMDALIVAVPNELVRSRVEAVELAGLEVEIVDVNSFAVYRALLETNQTRTWSDETIALVDFGGSSTTVSVISQGQFALVRSIPAGGNQFTEAIRSFFDMEFEEAEIGKAQIDLAEFLENKPLENPPLRVLQPFIEELVREIRRSINYYESQSSDGKPIQPVKTVVITGGGARMQGFVPFLESKLGLEVLRLGAFDNPTIVNYTASELGNGLELSSVTGLAMRPWLKAA